MINTIKKATVLVFIFIFALPLYAKGETGKNEESQLLSQTEKIQEAGATEEPTQTPALKKSIKAFFNFIDKKAYAAKIDKGEERKILRKKWKEWLGIDIFYPYFKAKEIEDWVKDKCSIKLFKMKGRPKFEKDRFTYTFKTKF